MGRERGREGETEKGWRQVGRDVCGDPDNRVGKQDDAPAPREVCFFVTVSKNEGGQPQTDGERREFRGVTYG